MFRDKANPLRRHRAVTLIEAVLYISIALALIVGGLVFFQQASTAAKTSATVRQLSAVMAETRVLIKGLPQSGSVSNPIEITSLLISAGAVPPDMVTSATSLSNPFGGTTVLGTWPTIDGPVISIGLSNVPQGVCARLLTATSGSEHVWASGGAGGTTLVSSGYVNGLVVTSDTFGQWRDFIMNPTQAGWMCKYGSYNYGEKTTQPSSTQLSGNVQVSMMFLVER
jgi:hypothetical protein